MGTRTRAPSALYTWGLCPKLHDHMQLWTTLSFHQHEGVGQSGLECACHLDLEPSCGWYRNIRTSSGTFLSGADDKHGVLRFIEDKIALLTGLPASHGEVRQSVCQAALPRTFAMLMCVATQCSMLSCQCISSVACCSATCTFSFATLLCVHFLHLKLKWKVGERNIKLNPTPLSLKR